MRYDILFPTCGILSQDLGLHYSWDSHPSNCHTLNLNAIWTLQLSKSSELDRIEIAEAKCCTAAEFCTKVSFGAIWIAMIAKKILNVNQLRSIVSYFLIRGFFYRSLHDLNQRKLLNFIIWANYKQIRTEC